MEDQRLFKKESPNGKNMSGREKRKNLQLVTKILICDLSFFFALCSFP